MALDFVLVIGASPGNQPRDAHAYWLAANGDLYGRGLLGSLFAYFYSPAFAEALHPLAFLPLATFVLVWRLALVAALAVMSGPFLLFVLFAPFIASELNLGNIHILLALVAVAGLRWPWLWSFALLTKITPGVGLLWFIARGEWRKLAIALGATAAIVVVSYAISPDVWWQWFGVLDANLDLPQDWRIPVPFIIRFPIGAGLVVWGARTDRSWTVPVAAMLGLPVLWFVSLSMLVGVLPTVLVRLHERWPDLVRSWPLASAVRA